MDLEYLIQNYKNRPPPGDAICLYIVQQNDMPQRYKDVYRCGAAGIKEALDVDRPYGSAGGNLISRMARYENGSPPCNTFSSSRRRNIGRFGYTKESVEADMLTKGVPLLRRTEEIIDYLRPRLYFIENPQTGRMKDFITHQTSDKSIAHQTNPSHPPLKPQHMNGF